jgi:predicted PurR-regulated permease PerM
VTHLSDARADVPSGVPADVPATTPDVPAAVFATTPAVPQAPADARERVPVRTILATIALVLATVALLWVLVEVRQILTWIVIAAFFAVALAPLVGLVERRVTHGRRALATLLVFLLVLLVLAGLVAAFAVPLAKEGTSLAGQLPQLIEDARTGRGPIGQFLDRTNALEYVQQNQDRIRAFATGLTTPAAGVLKGVATGIAGSVTIFVLAYLMVLEGPRAVAGSLGLLPPERRERVRRVAGDCARSVTGYITGNLLISVICGLLTYAVLKVLGVPFAALISLFVGIADLIPLVGATLGAVVAALAGFVHSVPAGIAVIVFFVLYQQLENHLLQPLILSRTVDLNPLTVLVAILVAVELAGILGALLAIPIAGMAQVVLRDLWDNRRGRPKPAATVGEEERPAERDSAHRAHGEPTRGTPS